MFEQQPLEILWDDLIPIDADHAELFEQIGLMPVRVALHSLDRVSIPQGPFILYVALDSFASAEALNKFLKSLGDNVFPVVNIRQDQDEEAAEALRIGVKEIFCDGRDSSSKWNQISRKARSVLLKSDSYVFVDDVSQHVLALIERIGPAEVSVLMNGPTGSGKEVLAKDKAKFAKAKDKKQTSANIKVSMMGGGAKETRSKLRSAVFKDVKDRVGKKTSDVKSGIGKATKSVIDAPKKVGQGIRSLVGKGKRKIGRSLVGLGKKMQEQGGELDMFDTVTAYLIDEGLVKDFDHAQRVMSTLDSTLIEEVHAQQLEYLKEYGAPYTCLLYTSDAADE